MNTVHFVSYGRIEHAPPSCPPVSNYLMRPGRWRWLQRLCFWVLERLGCKEPPHNPFPLPVVVPPMERITVNREQLVATLRDHLNELRRDEVRPVAVMMGPPQYKEAVQGFLSRPIVMVERFHVARNGLRLVEDLKVVLVPWMDGVVQVATYTANAVGAEALRLHAGLLDMTPTEVVRRKMTAPASIATAQTKYSAMRSPRV